VNVTLVPASAEIAAAAPMPATVTGDAMVPSPVRIAAPAGNSLCTHDQQVQAKNSAGERLHGRAKV